MDDKRPSIAASYVSSFSFVGLTFGGVMFAASLTPSLLPRPYLVQGILSGVVASVGYGLGVACILLYRFLEIPEFPKRVQRVGKWIASIVVLSLVCFFLYQTTPWQNSIRDRMEMPNIESSYLFRMLLIALITAVVMIAFLQTLLHSIHWLSRTLTKRLPPRVATLVSTISVLLLLFLVGNQIVWRSLISLADSIFLKADQLIEDGIEAPTESSKTGSPQSEIEWESIGKQGKRFLATGPTRLSIERVLNRPALEPIRVYAGMTSADTPLSRAELALSELIRVGAFSRSLLIIATPTGTGWLDPGAVDTVEYLHAGDTAIVSTQYSYLPSWITILVDPRRSIESADALFEIVYGYWKMLPKNSRPKLYLTGLSLGSLGSEISADIYSMFEDPIQGSVWSGPPFPSRQWNDTTKHRVVGSPFWLPKFRDDRLVRFTSQTNTLSTNQPWGPIRNVYIQYASDPMVFFSLNLPYQRPAWLQGERGPDVSPQLEWYPIVTFFQVAMDLPLATSVPIGYGHNYAPEHYIDAWVAVTNPTGWDAASLSKLKEQFRKPD